MYFYIYNTDHAQCAGKTEINKKVGTKENTVRMAIRARYMPVLATETETGLRRNGANKLLDKSISALEDT